MRGVTTPGRASDTSDPSRWNLNMAEIIVTRYRDQHTRTLAREAGAERYFTGKPCIRGHLSERTTHNGACIQCAVPRLKEWRKRNPKSLLAQNKRSHKKNAIKLRARCRAYKKSNPQVTRAYNENRRARKAATNGAISSEQFEIILKKQKYRCSWCAASIKKKAHMDHRVPLSKGGEHSIRNVVGSCPTCNMRKSAKDPIVWAQEIGLLI